MNLINDRWIPVIREDGKNDMIAPWQIGETNNPVIEINAPRFDFQGALYQFLIGLIQTTYAPEDTDGWIERWEEGIDPEQLKKAFESVSDAFELYQEDGIAFMQDLTLKDVKKEPIEYLLIDAPQENAREKNTDLFVKRDLIKQVCESCVATLLFTFNSVGPAVGPGYRVGIRGGGPLTTLVMTDHNEELLWKKLWLNIISQDKFVPSISNVTSHVFPWIGETKISGKPKDVGCFLPKGKTKCEGCIKCGIYPDDKSELYNYWSMPQRIKLSHNCSEGNCDICNQFSNKTFTHYLVKNYGNNYIGGWIHPLTPYKFDDEKKHSPNSYKGHFGGIRYKDWLGMVFTDPNSNIHSSKNVSQYLNEYARESLKSYKPRLWCFGYDLKSRKANGMYEHILPIFNLNKVYKDKVLSWISDLTLISSEVVSMLVQFTKQAVFKPSIDKKGKKSWGKGLIPNANAFGIKVEYSFWFKTENHFYTLLPKLIELSKEQFPSSVYQQWLKILYKTMMQLFEQWTLDSPPEDLDLKRIVLAKQALQKKYYSNKNIKTMKARSQPEEVNSNE